MSEFVTITNLFSGGCPSAIGRFVISVIVDPIDRMLFRWWFAHIGKKGFKTAAPSVAHLDSTASVSMEKISFGVIAPHDDSAPCDINFSSALAMCSRTIPKQLSFAASAIGAFSGTKIIARNGFNSATLAFTNPSWVPVFGILGIPFDYCPEVKSPAR
jgi:hypothetical protein